ncbi:hypothetical protein GGE66_000576 [Rhizobium leguminosarum]|uniref:Uncharacterized protein n=1 Tax=Rhizobium leguminosarum TaxID=384 RepID=A0A7W9ZMX5_RHILE|nr:hypothetical protein [Rhizobium leguminosarum]
MRLALIIFPRSNIIWQQSQLEAALSASALPSLFIRRKRGKSLGVDL